MKNILLLLGILLSVALLNAQSVQRNVVILEIGTGTWCTYCPGAAVGADELIDNGAHVAVIENHNGDPYANTYSNTRNSYYAVPGYPTANFDGVIEEVGGASCPNGNMYATYQSDYAQRYAVLSPISVCFAGTHVGNNYTVSVNVTKLANYTGNDLRLHLVLTESHIPVSWQGCMTEVNFVNRLMVPDASGTSVSFASGNTQVYTLNFTVDPTWNLANCELVAFVQDHSTKEVFNGIKSAINSLPATLFTLNDFTSDNTGGCSPVTVNFNTSQPANVTYSWTFEGGSPSASTQPAPSVQYAAIGVYDVILTGTDGVCTSSRVKSDYINVFGTPANPGTPIGENSLCENPSTMTYTVTPVPNADSYEWELLPPESGVITSTGNTSVINWTDTWIGTATLKVRAVNGCGISSWSPTLSIMIAPYPGQCPQPTGPGALCANEPNTAYATTGIIGATYYFWELTPSNAGMVAQGSSDTEIDWADDFTGTASLRVVANSGACPGVYSEPLSILVNTSPAVFDMSGGGTFCGPNGTGIPVDLSGSEPDCLYTLYHDGVNTGTTVTGNGNAISFGNQLAAGIYTVNAVNQNNCDAMMSGTVPVFVDPQAPEKPAAPTGPASVVTTNEPTSEYSTTGSLYASAYAWSISPPQAGSIAGDQSTGTVTWNPLYIGSSVIKVQGVNTCGFSEYSNEVTTTVNLGVGVPSDIKAFVFSLTPNPAHAIVTVTTAIQAEWEMYLVNSLGKTVGQYKTNGQVKEMQVDVSSLPAGVYTALISTGLGNVSLKLVVK